MYSIFCLIVFLTKHSHVLTAFYSQNQIEGNTLPLDAIPIATYSTTECIMACRNRNLAASMWKLSEKNVYTCYCTKENMSTRKDILHEDNYQRYDKGFSFTNVNIVSHFIIFVSIYLYVLI